MYNISIVDLATNWPNWFAEVSFLYYPPLQRFDELSSISTSSFRSSINENPDRGRPPTTGRPPVKVPFLIQFFAERSQDRYSLILL